MKHLATITDKDITGADGIFTAKPRIAVNAVLFDKDNNIALCYYEKYDFFTLVGGGVDPGEALLAALKREVLEEAGCDCEVICEIGTIFDNKAEYDEAQERYYYIARVVGEKGELHLTKQEIESGTSLCWYPIEEALRIISNNNSGDYFVKFIKARDIVVLTEVITNHAH